ncbi:endoribonuclease Dicer homolog 2-like isoform X2 [Gastrolobium bilobum]|uniref:endoribonuclease Dicer homolog 2-like isoform X2 n=1 Tax=Gastrolobium bilobum TaxID=150636 RepID=UPI002AAF2BB9|nr:endoribonuclease Dicer homolog 2-like isoform X2 [Gastrolobium bilobum]
MEEALTMAIDADQQQITPDTLPFARSYQLEALDKAIRENTIVYLETGSGKTLIAIMLLRSYAYYLRKPSSFIAVFLVPKVVLVKQQAEALQMHTDLRVGMYWGEMGVDFWNGTIWQQETDKHEVLVMTPAILLMSLRHGFLKLEMIKVLILDECHHARGKDPYACIMAEFYHPKLKSGISDLPRIFGMTASPVKSKVGNSEGTLSKEIQKLTTLLHSKVYTCVSEAVIAEFIPISTPIFKFYKDSGIHFMLFEELAVKLKMLKEQHELSLSSDFTELAAESARKRITKIFSGLIFCLDELGIWLALKAAESLSSNEIESFSWGKSGDKVVKKFSLATVRTLTSYMPSGCQWSIGDNIKSDVDMGLLTSKVCCLIDSLLQYRGLTDMRCIVFVERVLTAIVLQALLNALLPKYNDWKTKFIAGYNFGLQNQSRNRQNEIVEEFRVGLVNIIVATSILEEGLDVQNCNLVIRFDPSPTVCSFIQSRGRARMQNSDYILMVKSGDSVTRSRLEKFLASGDIMRKESLHHSSLPGDPFESDEFNEEAYRVPSTGAIANLSSSIGLIYLYCSRLPADGYFKPTPRWDKVSGTLYLPKSCPLQPITVQGDKKVLKNIACLEACKQLHKIGALTDNLVPDIVVEEKEVEEFGDEPYNEEQPSYIPFELVNSLTNNSNAIYYCYLMELKQNFSYHSSVQDIFLAVRSELDPEIGCMQFDMCFDRGSLSVNLRYKGTISLSPDQVLLCKRFQVTILRILVDNNMDKLATAVPVDKYCDLEIDYLLLPARRQVVDWLCISSVNPSNFTCDYHARNISTKNGPVCTCVLKNALVCTPHNGNVYITTDIMNLHGNSLLELRHGELTTYKKYFEKKHGIQLQFEHQLLLKARHMFQVKNYCNGCRQANDREASNIFVELPPELCYIIMSPLSDSTIYSFSFIPSIMHRLESLLGAFNLKKMHLDRSMQNEIQTTKGFIRNAPFNPKTWIIPGDKSGSFKLEELASKETKIYVGEKRKLKQKIVADVVEALIGAFLSTGGEKAALLFMDWIGIKVIFNIIPTERHFNVNPKNLVNVSFLESLLKYSFRDGSLLVEALTHGSYMLPEVPRCYQRLEFLGDSVLDYLITVHLFYKYPGLTPGQLTDMRAASVNNDCYAWSAIKAGLHKHVLHASQELHKHITVTLNHFEKFSLSSTFGWESEASFPKVLGDIIESLAGAIFVDSGYNKEVVWQSIKPLLEPLVTPSTLKAHPVKELTELCQKKNYIMEKPKVSCSDGVTTYRIEVQANGVLHKYEYSGSADKKTAKKIACKEILKSLR